MQEKEDAIEERDDKLSYENYNHVDGKFHKVRRKNTHLTPKKKKRK
jgi:hypothetical protein